jgi:hypothetical protein
MKASQNDTSMSTTHRDDDDDWGGSSTPSESIKGAKGD